MQKTTTIILNGKRKRLKVPRKDEFCAGEFVNQCNCACVIGHILRQVGYGPGTPGSCNKYLDSVFGKNRTYLNDYYAVNDALFYQGKYEELQKLFLNVCKEQRDKRQ